MGDPELIAGKYRIEKLLGEGGMGRVYRVRHEMLGQMMALKVLRPETLSTPNVVARFVTEARAAAAIKNEHVAAVTDVGVEEKTGAPYMVMELLDGSDMADVVRHRGKIPVTETIDYIMQALDALADAHAIGIIHRDLKPANMFLAKRKDGPARIKVLDFGISKASDPSHWLAASAAATSAHEVLGTPAYMSPEQLKSSKTVDARADLWSIGVVIFELLTGTQPFDGETIGALFAAIFEADPPKLRSKLPEAPEALELVVARLLQRRPEARYGSVLELAEAIAPFGTPAAQATLERIRGRSDVTRSPHARDVSLLPPVDAANAPTQPAVEAVQPAAQVKTQPMPDAPTREPTEPSEYEPSPKPTTDRAWTTAEQKPSGGRRTVTVAVLATAVGALVVAVILSNRETTNKPATNTPIAAESAAATAAGNVPPASAGATAAAGSSSANVVSAAPSMSTSAKPPASSVAAIGKPNGPLPARPPQPAAATTSSATVAAPAPPPSAAARPSLFQNKRE